MRGSIVPGQATKENCLEIDADFYWISRFLISLKGYGARIIEIITSHAMSQTLPCKLPKAAERQIFTR